MFGHVCPSVCGFSVYRSRRTMFLFYVCHICCISVGNSTMRADVCDYVFKTQLDKLLISFCVQFGCVADWSVLSHFHHPMMGSSLHGISFSLYLLLIHYTPSGFPFRFSLADSKSGFIQDCFEDSPARLRCPTQFSCRIPFRVPFS